MTLVFNLLALATVLALLVGITTAVSALIERRHPPGGQFVETAAGRLHIDDLNGRMSDDKNRDLAIVLIHGASGNLEDMRLALADKLPKDRRVVLIDRPGRGWSEGGTGSDIASPQRQADVIAQALAKIGVKHAIVVGHSLGGATALALAVRHPQLTAGLVLLAPASHPWKGGISWYYTLVTTPVIGQLFAHTLLIPIASVLVGNAATAVFSPQTPPDNYVKRSATWLVMRPNAFLANARDVAELRDNLEKMAPLYPNIKAPTVILTGDRDRAVSNDIHADPLSKAIPEARLEILPGVGHMVHYAAPERVVAAIDQVARKAGL